MGDYKWRIWARVVAYIDLIFSIIGAIFLVLAIVGLAHLPQEIKRLEKEHDVKINSGSVLWVAWASVMILILMTIFQIWLSVTLLKATEQNAEKITALSLAQRWRNIYLILVIIAACLQIFALSSIVQGIVSLFIRLAFILIVHCFIREMNEHNSGVSPV